MFSEQLTSRFVSTALNHVIAQNGGSVERLKPYSGMHLRFCLPLRELNFSITDDGMLSSGGGTAAADVIFTISTEQIPRLLLGDGTVWKAIESSGDTELRAILVSVFAGLRWDMEEDLSTVVGDIPAHYFVTAARKLIDSSRQSALTLGRTLSEYWVEEHPLLVKTSQLMQFTAAVEALAQATKHIEQRIERAVNRINAQRR
jgi:ubiquinone biosynthesis accessory factor UbiJ